MRVLSVCVVIFLIAASGLRAQQIVDFGQVEVGHDSTIFVAWWPPHEACVIRIDEPPQPFYVTSYDEDTTAGFHWNFELLFEPGSVGQFTGVVVHVVDANGNPTPYGLALRGDGVIASTVAPSIVPYPSSFALSAHPNPFNSSTVIDFSIPDQGKVTVKVFNLLGQQVSVLQDGILSSGEHRVLFDGGQLPAGIYFLRLDAATHQRTLKLVLLK